METNTGSDLVKQNRSKLLGNLESTGLSLLEQVFIFCWDFNSSALAEHAWICDQAVNWTNVKVLSNPRDYTTHMLEEAVFIRQTRDTLNRDCGTLPAEYENLFEKG